MDGLSQSLFFSTRFMSSGNGELEKAKSLEYKDDKEALRLIWNWQTMATQKHSTGLV